jgi:hypothetical protein
VSYKDTDEIVGQTPTKNNDPIVESYFPTYSRSGEVVSGATSGQEFLNESISRNQSDKMNFGTRNNYGEEIGGMTAAIYGVKKGIDIASAVVPSPATKGAKALSYAIPYASGVVSSWFGGAVGDTVQSVAQGDVNRYGWAEALDSAWDAGNRQAIYEALGQAGFSAAGYGFKKAMGDNYENIDYIRRIIKQSDGQLTASQVVDGKLVDTVEGLAESAWGGTGLRLQRLDNAKAIDNYVNSYANNFLDAADTLPIKAQGRLYKKAVNIANKQHSDLGGQMFTKLDELYEQSYKKTKTVVQTPVKPNEPGFDRYKMLNTTTRVTKKELVEPVQTKNLKSWAERELKKIKGTENLQTDWRYKEMKKILEMNDRISFTAAQELRSSYLSKLRNFENKNLTSYNTKDAGTVKALSSKIDTMLETAARDTQSDEFSEAFRAANSFWKTGKERLSNKFMAGLMIKNPEEVGAAIFKTGNQTEIQQARIALRYAQKITKGSAKPINFDKTWQTMQAGYLKNILGGATDTTATQLTQAGTEKIAQGVAQDVASREMNITNLKKMFIPNTPANETFKAAFTKSQRQGIKQFIDALEFAQKRPEGVGSFMVTVSQAQLVLTLPAVFWASQDANVASLATVGLLTISPAVLSRVLADKDAVRWLAQGMKTGYKAKASGGLATKLLAMVTGVGEEQYKEFE